MQYSVIKEMKLKWQRAVPVSPLQIIKAIIYLPTQGSHCICTFTSQLTSISNHLVYRCAPLKVCHAPWHLVVLVLAVVLWHTTILRRWQTISLMLTPYYDKGEQGKWVLLLVPFSQHKRKESRCHNSLFWKRTNDPITIFYNNVGLWKSW